jgi:hypothetical protein
VGVSYILEEKALGFCSGEGSTNVSLVKLADSVFPVVYILTDFISMCSAITERRAGITNDNWIFLPLLSVLLILFHVF